MCVNLLQSLIEFEGCEHTNLFNKYYYRVSRVIISHQDCETVIESGQIVKEKSFYGKCCVWNGFNCLMSSAESLEEVGC